MKKLICILLLAIPQLFGGTQEIRQDTYSHKIIKPPSSAGASYDLDFSDVTVNIGGGGGGGVGGSNQQMQYNNALTFGGVPYLLFNGSTVTQRAGARYTLSDPTDITKQGKIDLSAIGTGTTRTVKFAPSADSVTVIPATAPTNQFQNGVDTNGVDLFAQVDFSNLSGKLALSQTTMSTGKLIGRSTASTGAMEEITVGSGLTLSAGTITASGSTTAGGSNTQAQYNNSGVLGGTSTLVFSGGVWSAKANSFDITDQSDATKQMNFSLANLPTSTLVSTIVPNSSNPVIVAGLGAAVSHKWVQYITNLGVQTTVQPNFNDLLGTITNAQNSVLIAKQLWVDTTNGNDGTGARGDVTKPFATLAAALAATSSGDVVNAGPLSVDLSTTPLVIPSGVALIGSGADFSNITSAVTLASNRASVELGTDSVIANFSVSNTASSGIPVGNGSSSGATTLAYIQSCKIIGVSDGVRFGKTGTTGIHLSDDNISTQGDTVALTVAGTLSIDNCDIQADGTSTVLARGPFVSTGGTLKVFDSTVLASNSTTTNVAADATGSGSTLELHNVRIQRNSTGTTNLDFRQASSATLGVENASRADATAPTTSGTITQLSRYAVRDNNLSDLISASTARTNLGLGSIATQDSSSVTITGGSITGITDLALADGGTGASLTDPGADTLMGWDDTDNAVKFLTIGTGLTYTHATHTLSSSGGGGSPGTPLNSVQFNSSSAFAGDANLLWDASAKKLDIGTTAVAGTVGTQTPAVAAAGQAGGDFTVKASDAVAGNVTAGAVAGGALNLTSGDAKRLTSGNANGGNIILSLGAGIGTGVGGNFNLVTSGGGNAKVQYTNTGLFSIGIGTITDPTTFTVGDTGSSAPRGIMEWQASTDTNGARIYSRKNRGTFAVPTTIVTGDVLGNWIASGYEGTSYLDMGAVKVTSTGTIATTRVPTKMELQTATDAAPSVLTTALTLDQAQNAQLAGSITSYAGAAPTDGQLLIGDTSAGTFTAASLTAGSNVTITPAAHSITIAASGGTGTVTHTGSLTSNAVVLGNGTADTKVSTGVTTDGTAQLNLGVLNTTLGAIQFFGGTSGTATLQPAGTAGSGTITLPNASSTLPIYTKEITYAGPTAARTVTYPDANFTAARTDAANTFTGVQTMTSPAITTPTGIVSSDVGLGSVTNDAQTKAAIVPNTAPTAGDILVGNAGGTAYAHQALSGSGATATLSSAGVLTLSAIPNATLSNSTITIAGTSKALGTSITLDTITGVSSNGFLTRTAANTLTNTTAPTGVVVGDTDTQTLTNKTLTAAALGSSTATTQTQADNSTKVATTAYVDGRNTAATAPVGVYFVASLAGVDLKGANTQTIFTVPASRTFVANQAWAVVTAVTGAGAGTQTFQIKESGGSGAMTLATASSSGTPAVGTYYSSVAGSATTGYKVCTATNNVQVVISTSHAGSTTVTGTVYVAGFYF